MKFPYIVNLCYIVNEKGEVLLQKKRDGFGKGKWNGPGGKVDPGETVEESVEREVKEETGLIIKDVKKMGELEFVFIGKEYQNNYCHVFVTYNFKGEPEDMGEGELRWFRKEDIPFDKMREDDKYWLPDVLNGKYVHKRFNFNKDEKLVDYKEL